MDLLNKNRRKRNMNKIAKELVIIAKEILAYEG